MNSNDRLRYALDYRGYTSYPVASWILVSCGRRFDPHYFGDCGDSGNNQARDRSGSVGHVHGQPSRTDF